MSIGQEIIAGLEEFAAKLERGEYIEVTTVKRCECNPSFAPNEAGCELCRSGFIFSRSKLRSP